MKNIDTLKPSLQTRQKRRDKRIHKEMRECSRMKGWGCYDKQKGYEKNARNNDFENENKKERMKARSGGHKSQRDKLSPLVRFLEKREGKYWDNVYAELCKKVDKRTFLGQELFDHLHDIVAMKVTIENGRVMEQGSWGPRREVLSYGISEFYVHPKSGLFIKARKK